jgi:hypothetical protein
MSPISDQTAYLTVHRRLTRIRGKASAQTCECGQPAQAWAYQGEGHDSGTTGIGATHSFSTDLNQYKAMCRKCHAAFDRPSRHEP